MFIVPCIKNTAMDTLQNSVITPLQPYLAQVVSVIPEPVHDAVISLIGAPCHNALLLDLDVTKDPACTTLAISKALGIAIVGASAIVKVPQILKLIGSRSSAGVSFISYALETASLLITLSYSVRNQFPFSTYGETALIAVQDIAIGVLVLHFAGRTAAAATFVAVVAASIYALLFDQTLVDAQTMAYLQAGAGALGVASKAPQIYTIWREGGTGQLSAFTVSFWSPNFLVSHANQSLGVQLPRWIYVAHLHYAPGSRRQGYSLWLHRRIYPQRDSCHPNALVLEHPCPRKEAGSRQGRGEDTCRSGFRSLHWSLAPTRCEDTHHPPTRLNRTI